MLMQMIRFFGLALVLVFAVSCLSNDRSNSLAIYNLPANQQQEFFLGLTAEEQVEVLLASFKQKQAWDMRLLDWLIVSHGDVSTAVRSKIATETDDWHLETLAFAVERLSAKHSCRLSGNEADALLKDIRKKIQRSQATSTVERILDRHDKFVCKKAIL